MAEDKKNMLEDEQLKDVEGGGHKIPAIIFGNEAEEHAADSLRTSAEGLAGANATIAGTGATIASTEAASLKADAAIAGVPSSLEENIRIAGR